MTEKKVRQDIQAAIKPGEFMEIVRSGWGSTMTGPIPTYRKPWALPSSARPEFDPKKAKRLLTEAGYAVTMTFNVPPDGESGSLVNGTYA